MDKAPKRLWIDPDYIDNDCASLEQTVVNDTQYIRADLVDELVGALDSLARYADTCELFLKETHHGKAQALRCRVTKAKTALAKIKEGE